MGSYSRQHWINFVSALLAVVILLPSLVSAETQGSKQGRLLHSLQQAGLSPARALAVKGLLANTYYYDSASELLAATPADGIMGFAIDTDALYLRANSSWVALCSASGILGSNGGTFDNETNNVWEFNENSEGLLLTFGSNLVTFSSDSSATFSFTPDTNFDGDITAGGGAGAVTFDDSDSSIVVPDNDATALLLGSTGQLDLLTVDTTDGAEALDVAGDFSVTGDAKLSSPLAMVGRAYFCGNGANATTAVYMPPLQISTADDLTTYTYGAAGCDGLDNTTETSGDDYLQGNGALAVKVVGMACGISAAGTDDTYTFQLRDDAADVTGVTCNVTLDGAIQTCSVLLDSPVTVAAGSLWAVKSVAATDDDVSSADVECQVFYTY